MNTALQIAAFYVALNAIITLVLAGYVVRTRVVTKTTLGDGGNQTLLQAIRAHGNNVEYVPLVLVMLVTLALTQASVLILHIVGGALAVGRIAHGIGINSNPGPSVGRAIGVFLTLVAFITAVVVLFMKAFVF
jgi:uncharacterized membrane protein YecN with MAPEG domain